MPPYFKYFYSLKSLREIVTAYISLFTETDKISSCVCYRYMRTGLISSVTAHH